MSRGARPPRPPVPEALAALAQEHLRWLAARGYAAQTVKSRRTNLRRFAEWAEVRGITRPEELTLPVLERYREALHHARKRDGEPLGWGAQAQKLIAVKGLTKWLVHMRHLAYDPAAALELPRRPRRIPRTVLTAEEAEAVLAQPDTVHPLGLRDRAILELLYSSGLRRSELCRLDLSDLDVGRAAVLVREGKGRRDRFVPVGERALRWTQKYLRDARPLLVAGPDPGALFLGRLGGRLRPKQLSHLASRYLEASGTGKRGSAHLFRHTMATLMLEGGADLRYVQEMLGHADLSSTEVYTHVSIGRLQEVHRRTHPARLYRSGEEGEGEEERPDE